MEEESKNNKPLTMKERKQLRENMLKSDQSPIDIIYNARDGTADYDFSSLVGLGGGG